ncbi:MAG: YkgJ family cysteine cluster protein [Candidatus Gastranaerophilales bacterium]|nr:YkgJ family cysteine cluster protein [Candidatus Gastranaerophilales bacterium]
MSNLSTDVDNLKQNYREIFIRVSEEFNRKTANMSEDEFSKFVKEDFLKEAYEIQLKISQSRRKFTCKNCGVCCKLACSEFSPDELQQKAQRGDDFAQQFLSVFVPYKDENYPEKIYPEYFKLLQEKLQGENVYFYYCPKVTKDNLCPDYENRPQICRDFPDNPLGFLPKSCGFLKWKEEVEADALKLHAILEIARFFIND